MAEDGKVIYKVQIDDSGVESEAEAAGRKAGDGVERGSRSGTGLFKEAMIGAARAIGEAFVRMAADAVQGVEQIAKAGIDFNAKMEQYNTAFTTLLGSAEEAEKVMAQIRQDAASTPFDVDSLTQANQMLISAGISASDARDDVLNLANAVAATGGGSAELSRMAANMQQIKNVGKATSMDIRQFAMAGINIYGLLADYTGMTTEEVKDLDVSYEVLSGALEKAAEAGGAYAGAMEAQSQTFNGRMSTLKDNAMQLAGSLTEDLFTHLSGTALPMVMGWVSTLLEASQSGGIEGAIKAAKKIIDGLLKQFQQALPSMLQTGMGLLLKVLQGMADALPNILTFIVTMLVAIINTISANMPEIVQTGMALIMGLVQGLLDNLPQILQAGLQLLLALVQGIVTAIPQLVAQMPVIIASITRTLIANLPQIINAGIQLLMALITGLVETIPILLGTLPEIIMAIIGAFREVNWSDLGTQILTGLADGLVAGWNWLVQTVRNLVAQLFQAAKQALGIASPSKKFRYIGEMTGAGFEEGLDDTEKDITRTVTTIYSGVGETAENAILSGAGGRGGMEQSVSYALQATGTTGGATIIVPLSIDGREIARATAWTMGEQLAWEEM